MVGFDVAKKAAANSRLLRSLGVTIGKTLHVIIATLASDTTSGWSITIEISTRGPPIWPRRSSECRWHALASLAIHRV